MRSICWLVRNWTVVAFGLMCHWKYVSDSYGGGFGEIWWMEMGVHASFLLRFRWRLMCVAGDGGWI